MCSAISPIIQSLSRKSAATSSNEYKVLLLIPPGAAASGGGEGAFQFNVSVAACMMLTSFEGI